MDDLEQQIMDIAMAIGPFETTFLHCGYEVIKYKSKYRSYS